MRKLETYESRKTRVLRSAPLIVLDIVGTRQPIGMADLFEVARRKSPLLTLTDLQDVVMGLLCKDRLAYVANLRLVLTD